MDAADAIECVVGVRDVGDVHSDHCAGGVKIGGGVCEALDASEASLDVGLGREVEHFAAGGEDFGVFVEEKPEQAKALDGAADGAFCVGAVVDAVGYEASNMAAADGAVSRTSEPREPPAAAERSEGGIPQRPRNETSDNSHRGLLSCLTL